MKLRNLTGWVCLLLLSLGCGRACGSDRPRRNAAGVYEIADSRQLLYVSRHFGSAACPADGSYALTADIDLSETPSFEPIRGHFLGRFDGRGHAIRRLTIRCPERSTVGLFCNVGAAATQAVVENLALVEVYVAGRHTVGAIAGALYGTIRNCYVSGEVHAVMHCAGGLVGRLPEIVGQRVTPLLCDCFTSAAVICEGDADSQGGLSGRLLSEGGTIERCVCTGEVIGRGKTGGLVGEVARRGALRDCLAANRRLEAARGAASVGAAAGRIEAGAELHRTAVWEALGPSATEGVTALPAAAFADRERCEALGWRFDGRWSWGRAADGAEHPILTDFARLGFDYDFTWNDPQPAVRLHAQAETDRIVLRLESDAGRDDWSYCILRADRGLPSQAVWQRTPEARFEGLEAATAYPFCYKVREGAGRESRWYRTTVNTRYRASTDPTPRNVAAVVTADPSTTLAFAWTTPDTTLRASTVWLVEERDSARLSASPHAGTHRTEAVRGTINKRLYDGARSFHRATVRGLKPATRYLYRVGDAERRVVSPIRSVMTAPADEASFRFVYAADLQADAPQSEQAIRRMFDHAAERLPQPAWLFLAGDLTENGYNYTQWDRFFAAGEPLLGSCFTVPAQGNHDSDGDLDNHFPIRSEAEGIPFVYSFDCGCAHFIVLNTQYDAPEQLDRQAAWMERDLAAHRRRWNIVLLHKALYAATDHVDDADIDRLRGRLAPLFEAWGIDAVLMGHDHSFSRSFVHEGRNACVPASTEEGRQVFRSPAAPLYLVNGTGGISKWYHMIRYDASVLTRVSAAYEFIDRTSADYGRSLREQSFTLVEVTPQSLTFDTWFFRCDGQDPRRDERPPYRFDAVRIVR